ncbi:MAG: hypothetical protein OXT67_10780 [Zetaproteobacteria bacterium]|nr:hypothetical protein [Zetaproteobacteria bacterium]
MKLTTLLGSLCACALWATPTFAQVIKDNRIRDLGVTPSLGRGYSVATNTFQSNCLGTIATTTPSYDFKYRYVDIERDWEQTFSKKFGLDASFEFLFIKSNYKFSYSDSRENTYYYHSIFLKFNLDSYYHALDESNSALSDSALNLLTKGDAVGFFNACGPYYVKSVGRHSDYMAFLTYTTRSSQRDVHFEAQLKAKINGFFKRGSVETEVDTEFAQKTRDSRLQISIWAYGMGKDKLADLIATDFDSFKEAAQSALESMQNPDVGIVTAMEVVPWIENTEFQDNLKLKTEEDQLNFRKRDILQKNAEFVASIERIDRNQRALAHKAYNCRSILVDNFPAEADSGEGYDPDLTMFADVRYPGSRRSDRTISLGNFLSILTPSKVDDYFTRNETFLFGEDLDPNSGEDGAYACVDQLEEQGMDVDFYSKIDACRNLDVRLLSVPVVPFLENYCMPQYSYTKPESEESTMLRAIH